MLASCMGFVAQKKKCWTRILKGIAYFTQPYLIKSNSAPGHLQNMWGHSILLIKISKRHSLKHLQKVIVDGGKRRFQSKKNSTVKK